MEVLTLFMWKTVVDFAQQRRSCRAQRAPHPWPDPEATGRRPGLLRLARHLQRPHEVINGMRSVAHVLASFPSSALSGRGERTAVREQVEL